MSSIAHKIQENHSSWSLTSRGRLHFRSWDDDDISVVYNELSGDTHLVDALGVDLLQLLSHCAYSIDVMVLKLAEVYAVNDEIADDVDADRTTLKAYIVATLLQLQDAGLLCETFT
ncbi:hypothetical protein BH11PSE12_BH11PSE12_06700 [soil metagenome]